jgi:hypothetical protein
MNLRVQKLNSLNMTLVGGSVPGSAKARVPSRSIVRKWTLQFNYEQGPVRNRAVVKPQPAVSQILS